MRKDEKLIGKTASSVDWLKLTENEKSLLKEIDSFSEKTPKKIMAILKLNCPNALSFVKLAIHSKEIHACCRIENKEQWLEYLQILGKRPSFSCEFKIPNKLPLFDLVAGLVLVQGYLLEEKPSQKILVLYLAADIFHSLHAICKITEMAIDRLPKREENIKSVVKILDNSAHFHGSPGYLLYSWFLEAVGCFFLKMERNKEASAAFYLSYQYLLTAAKLVGHCANELHNNTYGESKFCGFEKSAPEKSFAAMISEYKDRRHVFIKPIQGAAEQTACKLSVNWTFPSKG